MQDYLIFMDTILAIKHTRKMKNIMFYNYLGDFVCFMCVKSYVTHSCNHETESASGVAWVSGARGKKQNWRCFPCFFRKKFPKGSPKTKQILVIFKSETQKKIIKNKKKRSSVCFHTSSIHLRSSKHI